MTEVYEFINVLCSWGSNNVRPGNLKAWDDHPSCTMMEFISILDHIRFQIGMSLTQSAPISSTYTNAQKEQMVQALIRLGKFVYFLRV